MTTQTPTCAGYALYLELEKGPAVTQILVMPEGMSSSHNIVPTTLYRRRLTPISPRKTWKSAQSPHAYVNLKAATPDISTASAADYILNFAMNYFSSLGDNGWKLRKQAIVIEVTAEDLEDSRMSRTPYKALGRVWKTRKKLGFPKEFLVAPAEATF